jgi:hypothetical protein
MKLRWKPHEFAFLPPAERALMYAFISERCEAEEKERKKLESKTRGKSRRSVRRR